MERLQCRGYTRKYSIPSLLSKTASLVIKKLSEIVVLFVQGKSRDSDVETLCTLKFASTLQIPFPNKHVQNYESSRLSTYYISTIKI